MSLYTKIIDIQKLLAAWDRVRRNKPAYGVDNVSWEMYDNNKKENIKQLHFELADHAYEPLPVKVVTIYKGEKAREIALYAMRDKVVQQAVAAELTRIYDSRFSRCAYAYRPNKSALAALGEVEEIVRGGQMQWSLKADIAHFFDTIDVGKLRAKLEADLREEDVVSLIARDCTAPRLTEDGELLEKKLGIYQGSAIAPILSNIYLMDFDREMEGICPYYLRYSDDILVLAQDRGKAEEILQRAGLWMGRLGLGLNENKTYIRQISEGFQFLGYAYDADGKRIPLKAEDNLRERLETMWYADRTRALGERLRKGAEILEGWQQYFRGERSLSSIYEYAVVLYMTGNKDAEIPQAFLDQRKLLHNTDRQLCKWLADRWGQCREGALELMEYEDYYQLSQEDQGVAIGETARNELLERYRGMMEQESEESCTELMQLYADGGCYNKASQMMEKIKQLQLAAKAGREPVIQAEGEPGEPERKLSFTKEQMECYYENFVGREELYVEEQPDSHGKRGFRLVLEPVDDALLKKHLSGQVTVGTYVQRSNGTAKYLVIDIDISRKTLLEAGESQEAMKPHMQKAANLAAAFQRELRVLGLTGYVEDSGFRGYHIWVLFTEWIPTRYIHLLEEILEGRVGEVDPGLSVEYFPNRARVSQDKPGQAMKLPFGLHIRSGRQSRFLEEDFRPAQDMGAYVSQMAKFSLTAVKRIIGAAAPAQDMPVRAAEKKVEEDLGEFQDEPDTVLSVLNKCNLMRYLCQKARHTGYLTHFERMSLLHVFGHMGDEGEAFLHRIMGLTLNYQYHVTQKFISRIPEKPISCLKLREQYRKITAEYGCSCNFNRIKNCYPSPVLHAIKSSQEGGDNITLPTSRTLSKEKKEKVCEELNLNKKVQDLASRILEFKKQKRGIDKNILKLEKELERLFDEAGVDCLEVEYGLLVRRKTEQGYEWLVEI